MNRSNQFFRTLVAVLAFAATIICNIASASIQDDIKNDLQAGHWEAADTKLQMVLDKHPGNATAQYWMAITKEKEGQIAAARQHLDAAKALDPQLTFSGDKSALHAMEKRLAPPPEAAPISQLGPEAQDADRLAPSPTATISTGGWIAVAFIAVLAFVGLVYWKGKSTRDLREQQKQRVRADLKAVRSDLSDARSAMEVRSDLNDAQRMAFDQRITKMQGDISQADYDVENFGNFEAARQALARGRDLVAEARGEEKPSIRDSRPVMAPSAATPLQPAPVIVQTGSSGGSDLLTGVLIGSVLSNHSGGHTSGGFWSAPAHEEISPAPATASGLDLDLGGSTGDDSMWQIDVGGGGSPDVDSSSNDNNWS